jgi:eukaryotic-like serine/threonine-protein kinase
MPSPINSLPESLLAQLAGLSDIALAGRLVFDLQSRWNNAQRPTVEDYLRLLPNLTEQPDIVLELLCAEWRLRQQFGPPPRLDEYRGRFPALAERLARFLQVDPLLHKEEQATIPLATVRPGGVESVPSAPLDSQAALSPVSSLTPGGGGVLVPGYEILAELGRGGMGVVYKARQVKLDRLVALKMILSGGHASSSDLDRFRTEAEAIARLQHPNIVQVHEVGEHDGKPYFSLEFCTGGSLDKKLDGTPLTPLDGARLVETLARAMQAAHDKNVIHRDLKPANVLLAEDGTPKITDFGLAKKLDAAGQTASGAIMGTPSYMAPEQAGGKSKEIGPAADIYGLGAILYELLTGRPPFRAATPLDTLLQAVENDPAPIRLLNPQIDRDLETICLKCLEKDPARRYPSARALADDLERYLAGEPISVRSINVLDRLARTLQRSQIDTGFEAWGAVLLWFAAIVLGSQIALFAVIYTKQSGLVVRATQGVQFFLMGLVLWRFRATHLLTKNAATKQVWSLWLGFLISCFLVAFVSIMLVGVEPLYAFFLYPYWAIVSGLCFFAMGSSHWGWFYAFGLAFFVLAPLLAWQPIASPLAFGGLWAGSLVVIGLRLRARAKRVTC